MKKLLLVKTIQKPCDSAFDRHAVWVYYGPLSIERNFIAALIKNWVEVFGVMGALMSGNDGEFSSDEMREIHVASILNVKIRTVTGRSSFRNGLYEREL